jgi:hypothetical protein
MKFSKNFNRIGEYCGSCKITKWRMRVGAQDSPEDMQKVSGGLYDLSQKLDIRRYPKQASSVQFTVSQTTSVKDPFTVILALRTDLPSISSLPMRFSKSMKFSFLSVCYISYPYHLHVCVAPGWNCEWKNATRVVYNTRSKTNVTLKSEKKNILLSGLRQFPNDILVYNSLRLSSFNT